MTRFIIGIVGLLCFVLPAASLISALSTTLFRAKTQGASDILSMEPMRSDLWLKLSLENERDEKAREDQILLMVTATSGETHDEVVHRISMISTSARLSESGVKAILKSDIDLMLRVMPPRVAELRAAYLSASPYNRAVIESLIRANAPDLANTLHRS